VVLERSFQAGDLRLQALNGLVILAGVEVLDVEVDFVPGVINGSLVVVVEGALGRGGRNQKGASRQRVVGQWAGRARD